MKKIYFILAVVMSSILLHAQEAKDFRLLSQGLVTSTMNEEARINYNNGTESLSRDELEKAEKYFLKAIELDPLFIDAMDNLGVVYRRQKRYDDAIAVYLKSISINDKNCVSHLNLALVYRLLNRYEDAVLEYKKVYEIDQENPESYYGVGQLYYDIGMYDQSIKCFHLAFNLYSTQNSLCIYDAGLNLAMAYYAINQFGEALKYFKFAASYYKDDNAINVKVHELEKLISGNAIDEN